MSIEVYQTVPNQQLLTPILQFLKCETPDEWVQKAADPKNLSVILFGNCISIGFVW